MNRRSVLKYFIIVSAGTALLPTCKPSPKKITAYNNLIIDEEQQAMLAAIAAVIIPDVGTPGSKEVGAHLFALQMLNDCYEQKDRDRFLKGMITFDKNVKDEYDQLFVDCSVDERHALIETINIDKDAEKDEVFFYNTMKRLAIQAYTGSKYYLTKVQEYKLVPGKFKSSVPV